MMGYLDRLKEMDSEKRLPTPLQKPQKDPSCSYCSGQGERFSEIESANDTPGDTPIPADLEHLIRRAGTYWEYSPEDYDLVRDLARRDPEGLRRALESDKWLAMAEWEAFEERAAIMEYDGGLSREDAERLASATDKYVWIREGGP